MRLRSSLTSERAGAVPIYGKCVPPPPPFLGHIYFSTHRAIECDHPSSVPGSPPFCDTPAFPRPSRTLPCFNCFTPPRYIQLARGVDACRVKLLTKLVVTCVAMVHRGQLVAAWAIRLRYLYSRFLSPPPPAIVQTRQKTKSSWRWAPSTYLPAQLPYRPGYSTFSALFSELAIRAREISRGA